MNSQFEVPAEALRWACDPSLLPFNCTADMVPLEDFIGQERAIRAIEFGLGTVAFLFAPRSSHMPRRAELETGDLSGADSCAARFERPVIGRGASS